MKRIFVLMLLFLLATGCQKSDYREVKSYTIGQFLNTTTIFGSSFSPDMQSILFTSDASGVFNAYTIPVAGGDAVQLTHSDSNSVYSISFFPSDNRILFASDKGGNEIFHIYLREEDGRVKDLTPWPGARSGFYGWSYDKKSFFFGSNKRDPRFTDVYEMDMATFTPKMIYQNDGAYNFGGISNDKRYMALTKTHTNHNSDLYLYDFHSKKLTHISPHEGDINYRPTDFSVDSHSLYYLTDENAEFTYLVQYNIEKKTTSTVDKADWDIMYAYFSRNGTYRVSGINNDAKTEIKIVNTTTGKTLALPRLPNAEITSVNISDSEELMTFYVNGSRSPSNLYVYNFGTNRFRKLTESLSREIDPQDLVDARVIRYKSFDGLDIPAILYKPQQIKPGEKAPALVWVHGGPGGQSRVGYRAEIQYLVNHGYVVLAVNNRGSSGYGKTFFKLDDRRHGEDDLLDCVWSKKYLNASDFVDSTRIGIIGGSYGGYMVLAAMAFQPEAFEVGVDIFGVANWLRTLESIPPWWEAFRKALYEELGDPNKDRDYLMRISPLFHADKIRKPLIVLQGANDPRVLKVESDEIVAAVKKNGVPVEYIVFDDEGHGFRKKVNRIKGWKAILKFLDTYLKNPGNI